MRKRWGTIGLAGAMALPLAGCLTGERGTSLDAGLAYPDEKAQDRVLNVQLIRDQAELSLTNTTATPFGPTVIWLNQEFSYEISGLEIGETVALPLNEFRNEYGKRFRAGGFFATERPKNVVLAQLEQKDSEGLLGIVVVDGVAQR